MLIAITSLRSSQAANMCLIEVCGVLAGDISADNTAERVRICASVCKPAVLHQKDISWSRQLNQT